MHLCQIPVQFYDHVVLHKTRVLNIIMLLVSVVLLESL
jgi:hypothetical protein